MSAIPTPSSRAPYVAEPAPSAPSSSALYSPATPTLRQTEPAGDQEASPTEDILGDAGAALFYNITVHISTASEGEEFGVS